MQKLTNLQKIRLAWSFGYSATLKLRGENGFQVMGMVPVNDGVMVRNKMGMFQAEGWNHYNNCDDFEITGYLYAGELAGNKIPEGQRFRVKETGEIGIYSSSFDSTIFLVFDHKYVDDRSVEKQFDKSEIEPVFD